MRRVDKLVDIDPRGYRCKYRLFTLPSALPFRVFGYTLSTISEEFIARLRLIGDHAGFVLACESLGNMRMAIISEKHDITLRSSQACVVSVTYFSLSTSRLDLQELTR